MFKIILTIVFLCITSCLKAEDSALDVKCPENAIIVVNGYKQTIGGTYRRYTFDFPAGEQSKVRLLVKDKDKVLYDEDVTVTGGLISTVDLLKKKDNNKFDLFGKIEKPALKKPNFDCIIHSVGVGLKEEKKPDTKENVNQVQNTPIYQYRQEYCITGT